MSFILVVKLIRCTCKYSFIKEVKTMSNIHCTKITGEDIVLEQSVVEKFKSSLRGELILPHDASYEETRKVWNGMINRKPAMIARCRGTADVIYCVNLAREHELLVAVRGGGHNVSGNAVCDGGLVIDLSLMRTVHVDPKNCVARADGGSTIGDIDHETQAFNLAAPMGVVSETGIGGLTLHGGMGWQLRKQGLSCDNLISVDIVTAEGKLLKASSDEHQDLFWAVKGGGGNFGVVTSLEYKLYPVGPMVWFAMPIYSIDTSAEAMKAFRDYMVQAPEELMAIAIFWSAPAEPEIPKKDHGAPVLFIVACYTGPFEEGERIIQPLRELTKPLADLSGPKRFLDVQKFFDAEFPNGRHYYWKSTYAQVLTDEIIQILVSRTQERPSPITSIDVWALGGAFSRVSPENSAFSNRDASCLVTVESNWENNDDNEKNVAWTRNVISEVQQFSKAGSYLNFPGFAEEGEDLLKGAFGDNYKRLQSIKAKCDPGNLFRGHLSIKPQ
jgi:FAD/FMN-containing dehydrogenase